MKTLQADDLQPGLAVTVKRVLPRDPKMFEMPNGQTVFIPTGNSTANPGMVGEPFVVVGVDLPFVRLKHAERTDGSSDIVSVRDVELGSLKTEMFDDYKQRQKPEDSVSSEESEASARRRLDIMLKQIRHEGLYGKGNESEEKDDAAS